MPFLQVLRKAFHARFEKLQKKSTVKVKILQNPQKNEKYSKSTKTIGQIRIGPESEFAVFRFRFPLASASAPVRASGADAPVLTPVPLRMHRHLDEGAPVRLSFQQLLSAAAIPTQNQLHLNENTKINYRRLYENLRRDAGF